ncbi:hypothetical protein BHM03_00040472, partial [Ensete ventricosum]
MSAVNITNVTVLDNPTAFLSPFQFEISYECLIPLEDAVTTLACGSPASRHRPCLRIFSRARR